MRRALFDVNVLIALLDANHQHHEAAHNWLETHIDGGWSSCPLTQNGCLRILAQPGYPNPIAPARGIGMLAQACSAKHHRFWADDISLLDPGIAHAARIHGPRQLTDLYLLALDVSKGGRFVTFDGKIPLNAVVGATADHVVVI
ncbi:MAG: VapC toxin family PIN domain ribonuclease [Xanthomonadales bacterium]|nr:VapC toxin family PIN domain ribonuclease [Xanthomonadales bacterium]